MKKKKCIGCLKRKGELVEEIRNRLQPRKETLFGNFGDNEYIEREDVEEDE